MLIAVLVNSYKLGHFLIDCEALNKHCSWISIQKLRFTVRSIYSKFFSLLLLFLSRITYLCGWIFRSEFRG